MMQIKRNRNHYILPVFLLLIMLLGFSCKRDYTPKPRGYFRIDLPERDYRTFDTTFPYRFEYPVYTEILPDRHSPEEKYWINIDYPAYKGRVHISYKEVDDNLKKYLEDARTTVMKHMPKASAIKDQLIYRPEADVYGLKYRIEGLGAASPYQFFVTDSSSHFMRGALYFNVKPNNDSLAPVIDFIRKDIDHLIESIQWN